MGGYWFVIMREVSFGSSSTITLYGVVYWQSINGSEDDWGVVVAGTVRFWLVLWAGCTLVLKPMTPAAASWLKWQIFFLSEMFVYEEVDAVLLLRCVMTGLRCCLEHTPFMRKYPQCYLRWHGARGDLSVLGFTGCNVLWEDCTDAAIAMTESSTLLRSKFFHNLNTTLVVVKLLRSPNIWSCMVTNWSPGKLSSRRTARRLSLILRSGSLAVTSASWVCRVFMPSKKDDTESDPLNCKGLP